MTGGDDSAVGELLLPPDLSPEAVRPLPGARTVHLAGETMGTVWSLAAAIPPAIAESANARVMPAPAPLPIPVPFLLTL